MTEAKTERQKWMDIEGSDTFLYVDFEKERIRIAAAEETQGYEGEFLLSNAPKKYTKRDICNLCYDLELKNITYMDKSDGKIPTEKQRAYREIVTDFKNAACKRYILLLKLTGSIDAFKYLSSEHVLVLAKFDSTRMKVYTQKIDDKPYALCFSSKDELKFFMSDAEQKNDEELSTYKPLSLRLRRLYVLLDKSTGVYINPHTLVFCDRALNVKIEHDMLKKYIKGVK